MAAGEPFEAYLTRHIFEPLTMRHTYTAIQDARRGGLASGYRYWFGFPVAFDAPGHGGTVPAGGIISTAEDMSRYLAMYQGGGRYGGQVVLSPAGIEEMMRPGPPQKRGAFAGAGYGMGWFTGPWGGVDASCHPGDEPGAHADVTLVPHGNWGIVVLFNAGTHGGALPAPPEKMRATRLTCGLRPAGPSTWTPGPAGPSTWAPGPAGPSTWAPGPAGPSTWILPAAHPTWTVRVTC